MQMSQIVWFARSDSISSIEGITAVCAVVFTVVHAVLIGIPIAFESFLFL
jgi:hypothetical protein